MNFQGKFAGNRQFIFLNQKTIKFCVHLHNLVNFLFKCVHSPIFSIIIFTDFCNQKDRKPM